MFEKMIRKFQDKTTPVLENIANTSTKAIMETVKEKASESLPNLILVGIFVCLIAENVALTKKNPISITYNFYGTAESIMKGISK